MGLSHVSKGPYLRPEMHVENISRVSCDTASPKEYDHKMQGG